MNNELTVQSILSLFETDKAQRLDFARRVLENVTEYGADPIRVNIQLKAMAEIIDTLTNDSDKNKNREIAKEFKKALLEAAEKNGKNFQMYNATMSVMEAGVRYDYTMCSDPQLNELLYEQERIDAQVKDRQEFLKRLPSGGMEIFDKDSGEVIYIYPPAKSSTTTLKTTLK